MSFLVLCQAAGGPVTTSAAAFDPKLYKMQLMGRGGQVAFILDVAATEASGAVLSHFDSRLWIIGRIRLDARTKLSADLNADRSWSDAELCLRAYARWGERALEHLHGDFCFGLWDEDRQSLFCARDRLGVRPMFYWNARDDWRFADSIASLRAHFSAPLSFDENWIGDFLQLGLNLDAKRSVFREIRRFPAAHEFSVGFQGTGWRRYWTLELAEPLFYRDKRQYIDQFRDLLETAIRDRLPEGRVGILLSGGLDFRRLRRRLRNLWESLPV